ncbi:MAG TPA: hypothetical protein VMF62_00760 [Acetobacteraceae bacterium]|jgi:hypothetical protein|nr:hypothetical protein [Acetobacteraceae bacterium]
MPSAAVPGTFLGGRRVEAFGWEITLPVAAAMLIGRGVCHAAPARG